MIVGMSDLFLGSDYKVDPLVITNPENNVYSMNLPKHLLITFLLTSLKYVLWPSWFRYDESIKFSVKKKKTKSINILLKEIQFSR